MTAAGAGGGASGLTLDQIVADFAAAMGAADARRPVATRLGGKGAFRPGIGPHPEDEVMRLCIEEMARSRPERYAAHGRGVLYRAGERSRCDLCLGAPPRWEWAIEAKLLRFLGDNGKPNGNMLTHVLSPYAQDCSAVTDCSKLASSGLGARKAVVIFGYHNEEWPLEPAIEAFEVLAGVRARLGPRVMVATGGLVHPVHSAARVFGWEVLGVR